jgi:hypothetical protein
MKYHQDRYWDQVSDRNPGQSSDRSWKCLCCKDTGVVDTLVLNQYYPGDRDPSDVGSRCQRSGCGEGAKYPGYSLNRDVSPEICQWLHEQDYEARLREPPQRSVVLAKVREGLERIAAALPAPDRDLSSDPILRRDPAIPHCQGDEEDW